MDTLTFIIVLFAVSLLVSVLFGHSVQDEDEEMETMLRIRDEQIIAELREISCMLDKQAD